MNPAKRTKIRGSRKAELLGGLIGHAMRCWSWTLRYQITDDAGITQLGRITTPVIYALWHNRIFTVPPVWAKACGNSRKSVVLTSASDDGAILASAMEVFGIGSVRGSSSRRAVAALIGMKRALQDGLDVCLTPDGPRGPRYEFHPGVVKLAESSGAPIIPVHAQFSCAWRLPTWDRFAIPLPFSRVHITFGTTITIPPSLSDADFQAQLTRVQGILLAHVDDA